MQHISEFGQLLLITQDVAKKEKYFEIQSDSH